MNDFMNGQASQKKPDSEAVSTESLESMSPAELADALEQLMESMTEESYDPDLIDAYLDALDKKAPMPEAPDTEKGLKELREKIGAEVPCREGEVPPTGGRRKRPYKRFLLTVAATVALRFALMVGAQAAGMDVFGSLARWTDEIFHFMPGSGKNTQASEYQELLRQALEEHGLPGELAPGWYPEGFSANEPQAWVHDTEAVVDISFWHEDGRTFSVSVEEYVDEKDVAGIPFEKDNTPIEEYMQNGRKFYIASNVNTVSAVWTDGSWVEKVIGHLSVEEIKMIIDSIGG